ncbi:MAG: nucleotidyltransferase family protein [Clostridia bacterium]|nr:nucleotidyltransferase family protein [Clostridia bacterium]
MKICAIISEYNPFHYGHLKHIQDAKRQSGADAVMVILSGNFTQRGEPTILNKHVRARIALEAGADIVVQMPTAYATSTAEIFALAGVKIANSFENVTHLAFGCETTRTDLLMELAKFFANEPKEYKNKLRKYLNDGNSLVTSRQKAIEDMIKDGSTEISEITEVGDILKQPNNILAIEYLKALINTNSKITPVFTTRADSEYNSEEVVGKNSSATAIRARLYKTNKVRSVKKLVPNFTYSLLKEEVKTFGLPDVNLFNDLCMYKLKMSTPEEIRKVFDVTEGLENRFYEMSRNTKDLNELLLQVKTKRYTFTRIKRIILGNLLQINAKAVKSIYDLDILPFIKVLAFKDDRQELLKSVSANTNLIIRVNNVESEQSEIYKELANIEDRANQVYYMLLRKNSSIPEYTPDLLTKSIKI